MADKLWNLVGESIELLLFLNLAAWLAAGLWLAYPGG